MRLALAVFVPDPVAPPPPAAPPDAGRIELEANTDDILLEDGTSFLLLEG